MREPTPCPDCGAPLALGPQHLKKKMRCPRCGCRFIAGTGRILSRGRDSSANPAAGMREKGGGAGREAGSERPPDRPAKPPGPAHPRSLRCVVCGFDVETQAPEGTAVTCPICNTTFSGKRKPQAEASSGSGTLPGGAGAAVDPGSETGKGPSSGESSSLRPKTPVPAMRAISEIRISPPGPPKLPPPAAPSDPAPGPPPRSVMLLMEYPMEAFAVMLLSGFLAGLAILAWAVVFFGTGGLEELLIGKVGIPEVVLPLIAILLTLAGLGLWKREMWGWILATATYGAGTFYFVLRLGSGQISAFGSVAAVCLILLVFTRLSGRFP